MATHESVPSPLPPAGTCPSLQGGGEPVWALFVPPPRFRCRVHAVEISASGHGWLSLAVKIKRRCWRRAAEECKGTLGCPQQWASGTGLWCWLVTLWGAGLGTWLGGAVQERVQGAQAALGRSFCWARVLLALFPTVRKTADLGALAHVSFTCKVRTLDPPSAAHASDTCHHYPFQFPSTVRAVLMQLSGEWASPTQTE